MESKSTDFEDKLEKAVSKGFTFAKWWIILSLVVGLLVSGGFVWVVLHFVSKFW